MEGIAFVFINITTEEMALWRNLPVVAGCTTHGVLCSGCVDSALVYGCLATVDDVV